MSGSYPKHNRTRTAAGRLTRFALIVLLFTPAPAFAQDALRGVALVIGQSEYEHLSPLPNPANDADAIETLLSDLGFDSVRRADRKAANLTKDLERFAEDAEGADVAVLYYSGHGIEAGGENWLVPVDADLSALDDAGEKLVPVSALIDKLKATVPVVIVMLDACRNNPFPPGSELRLSPGAEPIPVGNTGLALSRSVVSLKATSETASAPDENVGTVIAFAAEPGKVALDGDAGSNSPYAAALLRHFDAMAGEEFGMVMRMVAEEVYLKTGGRQRPWVNESLRRLLYFGEKPAELSGDEGDILRERRGLLITIAALPDPERRQVESAALNSDVPMDALYGVLKALGRDAPDDPEKLEELLKTESERIAKILSDRAAISSPDPEIVRISALADTAEKEGLLVKADELRNRAKQRFREIEGTLEQQEAALNQRFIEGAEVFARSAQTKAISFDHLGAAGDYAEAVRLVDGRDPQKAWFYANARLLALTDHGKYKGDNAALEQAVAAGRDALRLADRAESLRDRASTQNNLGNALLTLGERDRSVARYEEAVVAYRAALQDWSREREPFDWATAQSNLGVALRGIGERESGIDRLEESVDAFNKALEVRTRFRSPHGWSETKINLGNTLLTMGHRETGVEKFEEAVAVYRDVLELWTRDYEPMGWAAAQNNLGMALSWSGARNGNAKTLDEALEAFNRALEVRTRERAPMIWAATMANMGQAYTSLGLIENDDARLRQAIETYRMVLGEFTRDRTPLQWATASLNLGNALQHLGIREAGLENLNAAVAQYDAVLEEFTREVSPVDWAMTQHNLGVALGLIGERASDENALLRSAVSFRASLLERTRDRFPHLWAEGQQNLGMTLARLGVLRKDVSAFDGAAAAFRNALQELNCENNLANWAVSTTLLAYTTRELGQQSEGEKSLAYLEEALQAFRNLASAQSRAEKPGPWASTQNDIGYLLVLIGEQRGDLARLEEAQAMLAEALAVQREIKDPSIPYVADSLCRAKRNIGQLKSDRTILLEARALCEESVAAFAASNDPQASVVADNLEQVNAMIAKVK